MEASHRWLWVAESAPLLPLDSRERRPARPAGSAESGETVGQRLDAIGFGYYQVQVLAVCGCLAVASAAQTVMAVSLATARAADMQAVAGHPAPVSVAAASFAGRALGILASAALGDWAGRRLPIAIGLVGLLSASAALCALEAFRLHPWCALLLGACAGVGMPAALVAVSEVVPSRSRGAATAALGVANCAGDLWGAVGARLFTPDLAHGSWRALILWASLPAAAGAVVAAMSRVSRLDTPHYYAALGDEAKLDEVLGVAAELNGRPELAPSGHRPRRLRADTPPALSAAGALAHITRWPLGLHTAALFAVLLVKDFGTYGMRVLWPSAYAGEDGGLALPGLGMQLGPADSLLLTVALGIPGYAVAIFVMHTFPRRPTLAASGAACALIVPWLRPLAHPGSAGAAGVAAVAAYRLAFPTLRMTAMLLPSEVLPTSVRVLAFSCVEACAMGSSLLAESAVSGSPESFLRAYSALAAGLVLASAALPETKDRELQDAVGGRAAALACVSKAEAAESGSNTDAATDCHPPVAVPHGRLCAEPGGYGSLDGSW